MRLFWIVLFLFYCISSESEIQKIQTRKIKNIIFLDNEFKQINEIQNQNEVLGFKNYFINFSELKQLNKKSWSHKIDIEFETHSESWLYDSKNGIFAKLNYRLEPCFKILENSKFNQEFLIK